MKIFHFKTETMNHSSTGRKCPAPARGSALDTTGTCKSSTALSHLCTSAFPPEVSGYQPDKPSCTAPQKAQLVFEKLFDISCAQMPQKMLHFP